MSVLWESQAAVNYALILSAASNALVMKKGMNSAAMGLPVWVGAPLQFLDGGIANLNFSYRY